MLMGKVISAGLLCVLGLLAAPAVQAETWCLRQHGSQSQVCAFPSARDCTMAATFGAFGGVCEREALGPRPKADKRRTDRKPARDRQESRQDRRQDPWWW
jgi:hypothetical protein